MAYIGTSPQNGVRNRFVYAATQGQTAFTGADSDGKTLAISDQLYTDVYQNGVKLKLTTDWTASSTTVTLVNAASVSDVIEILSFDVFSVSDTVPASTGGAFAGGISATTISGSVTSGTTSTFTSTQAATNADILKLNATQTNSSSNLKFQINGGSTAQGQIRLGGNNDITIHNTSSDTERLRITSDGRGLSQFTAKAWVNFNGTGTVAIRDSHNVSSITDNGTGQYRTVFANTMTNADYSFTATSFQNCRWATQNTSYAEVISAPYYGAAHADSSYVNVIVFGD